MVMDLRVTQTITCDPEQACVGSGCPVIRVFAPCGVLHRAVAEGQTWVVGRGEAATLRVHDARLSSVHARLTLQGDELRVEDLASKNGTFVDGTRVASSLLAKQQLLALGSCTIELVEQSGPEQSWLVQTPGAFRAQAARELAHHALTGERLSIVVIELRDELGPRCASQLARLLLAPERMTLLNRHLLVLLLPGCAAPAAQRRFAELCERAGLARSGGGLATYPEQATSYEALLEVAHPGTVALTHASVFEDGSFARTPSVNTLLDAMLRASRAMLPILLHGETGTGKSTLARALHEASSRRARPFVTIDCGNLQASGQRDEARFDRELSEAVHRARGGTLLLDRPGELDALGQSLLLRSLGALEQEGDPSGSVQLVSATQLELDTLVAAGSFRADLLHRLRGVLLECRALRRHPEEIELFAQRFVRTIAERLDGESVTLSDDALVQLRGRDWPGNLRELRSTLAWAVANARSSRIDVRDVMSDASIVEPTSDAAHAASDNDDAPADLAARVRDFEARAIRDALAAAGGNQRKAAESLQMPLRTLVYKLRGLREPGVRPAAE